MQYIPVKAILVSGVILTAAAVAPAQSLSLPGKTLSTPAPNRAGIIATQPAKNVKNVLGGIASPVCPHIGKSLSDLMSYARANHPAIYRQAVALRRTGFTQDQVRDWLENELCTIEGF
jgi:hypothetical protein